MGTYRDEHEKEAMVKDINCGLWSASRDAKTHKVIKRLQEGANPNTTSGSYYSTPLHEAANKGSVEVAELLLAAGANPDARDGVSAENDATASYAAVPLAYGNLHVRDESVPIVDRRVCACAMQTGNTPLQNAQNRNHTN